MIDQKKIVIDKVVSKMSERLSNEDLSLLEATLIISLNGLKVEEECTALIPNTRDWDFYISMFHANKRLNNCSEKTLKLYDFAIGKLRDTIHKNPTEIDTNDIKFFLAKYSVTPSITTNRLPSKTYINNLKNDISSFFKFLCDEGYIGKNPVAAIPKIKTAKLIKHAYSGEDLERLKTNAKTLRDIALIYFLDATGMRIGEAVSVNKSDINWSNRSLVIYGSKGKAERICYFTEECSYHLNQYLNSRNDENEALFVTNISPFRRLSISAAEEMVRNLGKTLGIHAHPHRFRRTMITRLNKRGMNLQDIQTLAGHANATTTQIYIDMQNNLIAESYNRIS